VQVGIVEPEDAASIDSLVRQGRCDVGLAELPGGRDLEVIPLGEQAIVAIAPATARLPTSGRAPLARLASFPLVSTPPGTSTRDLVDAAFARAGVTPRIAVETTHREALVPLVVAGAGITFLPRALAQAVIDPRLRVVAPTPAI